MRHLLLVLVETQFFCEWQTKASNSPSFAFTFQRNCRENPGKFPHCAPKTERFEDFLANFHLARQVPANFTRFSWNFQFEIECVLPGHTNRGKNMLHTIVFSVFVLVRRECSELASQFWISPLRPPSS